MKTTIRPTLGTSFGLPPAQVAADKTTLRSKSSKTRMKIMPRLRAIILLVLLGAAAPLLYGQSFESYTFTTNRLVPDGNASGLSDVHVINSTIGTITSLQVRLKMTGEFNGDVYAYLRHVNATSTNFVVLLNRVGRSATNSEGYSDSGFNVTFQAGATNGDIHLYQAVTNPAAGAPLIGIWDVDGRTNDPSVVLDTNARKTSLTNFVGSSASGTWTLFLADMESGGTNMLNQWELDINGQAYPALTWTNPADIVYGTALGSTQLNATATYASTNVHGTFAYTPAAGTVLNAGSAQTLSVTFTPSDSASFLPISTNVTINVTQAPLTITANNTNRLYGSANPAFTASYTGFVNGDTAASLATPPSFGTSANAASPIGNYTITASGAAAANYTISYAPGTLTVNPAPLTITANNTNRIYGVVNPVFTASYSGFVNSDTPASLTTPVSLTTTATAASPAGNYTITASGAAYTNYSISFVNGTLSVGQALLTVTADNKSKAYGQALPVLTATYSGFVNGDGTNNLTSLASLSTTATSSSDVGAYAITASGAVSSNYTFNYVGGTLTITQSLSSGVLVSSSNPALPNTSVTFTATLSAVAPGAGTPTGSVNFRIDGSIAGTTALSGGVATFSTSSLAHGNHTVVAEYSGSVDFVGTTNTLSGNPELINTPPVAGGTTIYRYPTQGVKVSLATLRGLCSDADGDSLNLTVSSTSANGGTVSVNGSWVLYTPANGFTNADSFTYTVSDGYTNVTGTVSVAIIVDNNVGANLTITALGGNSYLIHGDGIPGRTYRLQYTDTLSPANWQDIAGGSVTADSTGQFQYTDTSGSSARYYRTVYP